MASQQQHGRRFASSPIFNQNFSPNNFNVNPGMNRPPAPQFQRPLSHPNGHFQSPEGFFQGYENRPQISNFPNASGFLNRPPFSPSSNVRPQPLPPHNPVPGSLNSCPQSYFPDRSNPPHHPPHNSVPGSLNSCPQSSFPDPSNSPHLPPHNPVPGFLNSCPQSSFPDPSNSPHLPPHNSVPGSLNSCPQSSFPDPSNPPHLPPHNPVPGSLNSCPQSSFPDPSNSPHLPPHNSLPGSLNSCPQSSFPDPSNPTHFPFSGRPNSPRLNFTHSSTSINPPFRSPLNSSQPRFPNPSNSFPPPLHSQSPAPPHSSFTYRPPAPSRHSAPPFSLPQQSAFSSQRSFSPSQASKQRNQHPNMSYPPQRSQFPPVSHLPNQHQGFNLNSQSSALEPQFDDSFKRPFRNWHKKTRFSGSKTPFSNQSLTIVKSYQFKDSPHVGKKRKERSREFKKLKDDPTDKPYSCDTCDRAFVSENELKEHISQHIKCDYENCNFEAHPKIVMLHQKMQHETGYAEKISKLKDDAEIKKWREERRKRFPTAENIRKRKAEQMEREARGEVLETKDFGKFKRRNKEIKELTHDHRESMRGHRARRKKFRQNFHEQHPGFLQHLLKVKPESDSDSDSHILLNMFSGLPSVTNSTEEINNADELIESEFLEQNSSKVTQNINKNELTISHSENNLISRKTELPDLNIENLRGNANPANESVLEIPEDEIKEPKSELVVLEDSDDEGPEVIAISKSKDIIFVDGERDEIKCDVNNAVKVSDLNHEDARKKDEKMNSGVNDASRTSDINHEDFNRDNQSGRSFTRRRNNFCAEQYAANQVRKSSLLEKLLADDIRHERNVILQCIRHIVNNNFFGLAVKK